MVTGESDGSVLVAALGGLSNPMLYTSVLLHIAQIKPGGKHVVMPNFV